MAAFQQRGLAPSTTDGPFTIAQALADIEAVLDHLGWDRAYLLGHSYGGHLVLHAAAALPHRLLGVLSVEPIGAVGDGGAEAFGAAMMERLTDDERARAMALNEAAQTAVEASLAQLQVMWPSYFADHDRPAPFPTMRMSKAAGAGLWPDMVASMPGLAAALRSVSVPVGVLVGDLSPMPADQAGLATAARIPGAWTTRLHDAGHFVWFEQPGCLLEAMRRLAG